jgi:hypothetical protein
MRRRPIALNPPSGRLLRARSLRQGSPHHDYDPAVPCRQAWLPRRLAARLAEPRATSELIPEHSRSPKSRFSFRPSGVKDADLVVVRQWPRDKRHDQKAHAKRDRPPEGCRATPETRPDPEEPKRPAEQHSHLERLLAECAPDGDGTLGIERHRRSVRRRGSEINILEGVCYPRSATGGMEPPFAYRRSGQPQSACFFRSGDDLTVHVRDKNRTCARGLGSRRTSDVLYVCVRQFRHVRVVK